MKKHMFLKHLFREKLALSVWVLSLLFSVSSCQNDPVIGEEPSLKAGEQTIDLNSFTPDEVNAVIKSGSNVVLKDGDKEIKVSKFESMEDKMEISFLGEKISVYHANDSVSVFVSDNYAYLNVDGQASYKMGYIASTKEDEINEVFQSYSADPNVVTVSEKKSSIKINFTKVQERSLLLKEANCIEEEVAETINNVATEKTYINRNGYVTLNVLIEYQNYTTTYKTKIIKGLSYLAQSIGDVFTGGISAPRYGYNYVSPLFSGYSPQTSYTKFYFIVDAVTTPLDPYQFSYAHIFREKFIEYVQTRGLKGADSDIFLYMTPYSFGGGTVAATASNAYKISRKENPGAYGVLTIKNNSSDYFITKIVSKMFGAKTVYGDGYAIYDVMYSKSYSYPNSFLHLWYNSEGGKLNRKIIYNNLH